MRTLFIVATSIFLLSCAAFDENKIVSPYENYKLYLEALKVKDYNSAASMLSLKSKNQFTVDKDFNDIFPFFSSIDTVVTNETTHYQKTFGSKSCLTVNGFNSLGEPTSLNFELINENSSWKFSYVQMMYHDSQDEFPSSVNCPPKP